MKNKISAILAVVVLVLAQWACNMPASIGEVEATQDIPSPNKTLTALFAITPPEAESTSTATLPPVVTATSAPDDQSGGGVNPTATTAAAATVTHTPAVTAQKTATKVLATATVPSTRIGTQVVANFLSKAPTLDGDWSEWKDTTKEYPATNVVFGKQNWSGEADLAGSFHVGWDNTYLYLAVKVIDDKYVQNASGENIFKGDSIDLLFDTRLRDDFYTTRLSPDDFQLGINPGRPDVNGTKEAYLWFPSNIAGKRSDVKIASISENGVYRVEIAIPWTVLEMTPAAGTHIGFTLAISDNDNSGENLQQSMVSNSAGRSLVNPTTWGDLSLVK